VKCSPVSVHLRIIYHHISIGLSYTNQHFLHHCLEWILDIFFGSCVKKCQQTTITSIPPHLLHMLQPTHLVPLPLLSCTPMSCLLPPPLLLINYPFPSTTTTNYPLPSSTISLPLDLVKASYRGHARHASRCPEVGCALLAAW
jgi:hypothetical protein